MSALKRVMPSLAGALLEPFEQQRAEPAVLPLVDHGDRDFGDPRLVVRRMKRATPRPSPVRGSLAASASWKWPSTSVR